MVVQAINAAQTMPVARSRQTTWNKRFPEGVDVERLAKIVTLDEIRKKDFNLSPSAYRLDFPMLSRTGYRWGNTK